MGDGRRHTKQYLQRPAGGYYSSPSASVPSADLWLFPASLKLSSQRGYADCVSGRGTWECQLTYSWPWNEDEFAISDVLVAECVRDAWEHPAQALVAPRHLAAPRHLDHDHQIH